MTDKTRVSAAPSAPPVQPAFPSPSSSHPASPRRAARIAALLALAFALPAVPALATPAATADAVPARPAITVPPSLEIGGLEAVQAAAAAPQPLPQPAAPGAPDAQPAAGARGAVVRMESWLKEKAQVYLRSRLVEITLASLGTPYVWGGNDPDQGFDCSGLVRFVYQQAAGLELPRIARQQRRKGKPVQRAQLRPGDLVFFNTRRNPASHVGIYIGDGRFVHAPSRGSLVRIDKLGDAYWSKRYTGARRYLDDDQARQPA